MPRIGRWSLLSLALLSALILLSGATATLSAQEAEGEAAGLEAEAETSHDADAAAAEAAATEVATEWLALIDEGEYEESWYEAGSVFQDAVTPEQWNDALGQARGPLEPFGERELTGADHATDPPNAPAGEYVIVNFRTQVEGDRTAVETVATMKVGDGWKVVGYFVQPE